MPLYYDIIKTHGTKVIIRQFFHSQKIHMLLLKKVLNIILEFFIDALTVLLLHIISLPVLQCKDSHQEKLRYVFAIHFVDLQSNILMYIAKLLSLIYVFSPLVRTN